ncbi:MAG: hypothetical protein ACK587_02240 [Cyanobacteriota bacterium]
MADSPYLVALALVEQEGKRLLPLTGKSCAAPDPQSEGRALALDLLLRRWQRSDEGSLRRAAGEDSLLLLELPLEVLTDQIPRLKAAWLAGGDTASLLRDLRGLARRGWRLAIAKREPASMTEWF